MMSSDVAPTVGGAVLEHRALRSAIEFAVAIAAEGQKLRPPLAYPAALKPFLRETAGADGCARAAAAGDRG